MRIILIANIIILILFIFIIFLIHNNKNYDKILWIIYYMVFLIFIILNYKLKNTKLKNNIFGGYINKFKKSNKFKKFNIKKQIKLNNNDKKDMNNFIKINNKHLKNLFNQLQLKTNIYYKFNQLKYRINYQKQNKNFKYLNINCHLGQRKLLLTELEFYNKCYNRNLKTLVIYAGSASCEHLPAIINYFPKIKFILIDPNYHLLGTHKSQYKYIYQNKSIISEKNRTLFKKNLKYHYNSGNLEELSRLTNLLKVDFLYKKQQHNVLYYENNKNIFVDEFYKKNKSGELNLIQKIFDDKNNVFIFQDYMRIDLTKALKKEIDIYRKNNKCNLLFLTDIRTNFLNVEDKITYNVNPSDIDFLWNYALQIIFIKILIPTWSMLKFRPPYFNDTNKNKTKLFIKEYNNILKNPNYSKKK